MTPDQYAAKLEQYHQTILRQVELLDAAQARERRLQIEVDALKVKFEHLQMTFARFLANQYNRT